MGDPLNLRLTGIVINQPDLPHWCTSVLNWLAMVKMMQEASGDLGKSYREQLKNVLEAGGQTQYTNVKTGKTTILSGPRAVYGLHQSFCAAIEREASK